MNEVVSYVANQYLQEQQSDEQIHPNDDVNKSQSYMLEKCETLLAESKCHILNLAIGGTAVGTGINAHPIWR